MDLLPLRLSTVIEHSYDFGVNPDLREGILNRKSSPALCWILDTSCQVSFAWSSLPYHSRFWKQAAFFSPVADISFVNMREAMLCFEYVRMSAMSATWLESSTPECE